MTPTPQTWQSPRGAPCHCTANKHMIIHPSVHISIPIEPVRMSIPSHSIAQRRVCKLERSYRKCQALPSPFSPQTGFWAVAMQRRRRRKSVVNSVIGALDGPW